MAVKGPPRHLCGLASLWIGITEHDGLALSGTSVGAEPTVEPMRLDGSEVLV